MNNLDVFSAEFVCKPLSYDANLIMLKPRLHPGPADHMTVCTLQGLYSHETLGSFGDQKGSKGPNRSCVGP